MPSLSAEEAQIAATDRGEEQEVRRYELRCWAFVRQRRFLSVPFLSSRWLSSCDDKCLCSVETFAAKGYGVQQWQENSLGFFQGRGGGLKNETGRGPVPGCDCAPCAQADSTVLVNRHRLVYLFVCVCFRTCLAHLLRCGRDLGVRAFAACLRFSR